MALRRSHFQSTSRLLGATWRVGGSSVEQPLARGVVGAAAFFDAVVGAEQIGLDTDGVTSLIQRAIHQRFEIDLV